MAGTYDHLLANFQQVSDALAVGVSEALVSKAVGLGLVRSEPNVNGIRVKKWRKMGSLTASALAEGAAHTASSNEELTDTSVTTTLAKKQIPTFHTDEELRFGGDLSGWGRFEMEHGNALARLFDSELKALFTSLSNTAGGTGALNIDHLYDARYYITSTMKGAFSGQLVSMVSYKQSDYVRKDLKDAASSAYVSQVSLGPVLGLPQANGYIGRVADIDMYETDGIPTDSDQDWGAVWDPMNCFCALIDEQPTSNELKWSGSNDGSRGYSWELDSWTYWDIKEWNDGAGCGIGSAVTS